MRNEERIKSRNFLLRVAKYGQNYFRVRKSSECELNMYYRVQNVIIEEIKIRLLRESVVVSCYHRHKYVLSVKVIIYISIYIKGLVYIYLLQSKNLTSTDCSPVFFWRISLTAETKPQRLESCGTATRWIEKADWQKLEAKMQFLYSSFYCHETSSCFIITGNRIHR